MPTKGLETWSSEDSKTSTGIWECGAGSSRWEMKDEGELVHVVSGRMTCTAEDGERSETAIYDLLWRTEPGGLIGGRSFTVRGLIRRQSGGDGRKLDALWASEAPKATS